jgi:hypothetical protein
MNSGAFGLQMAVKDDCQTAHRQNLPFRQCYGQRQLAKSRTHPPYTQGRRQQCLTTSPITAQRELETNTMLAAISVAQLNSFCACQPACSAASTEKRPQQLHAIQTSCCCGEVTTTAHQSNNNALVRKRQHATPAVCHPAAMTQHSRPLRQYKQQQPCLQVDRYAVKFDTQATVVWREMHLPVHSRQLLSRMPRSDVQWCGANGPTLSMHNRKSAHQTATSSPSLSKCLATFVTFVDIRPAQMRSGLVPMTHTSPHSADHHNPRHSPVRRMPRCRHLANSGA